MNEIRANDASVHTTAESSQGGKASAQSENK